MSPYAHITGWGMAIPEKVLTNEEIAQKLMVPTRKVEEVFSAIRRQVK